MIVLNKDYRIKSDKYCWVLEIRSDGKTSKGEHRDVWEQRYYPTFEKVAQRIVQEEAKFADSLEGVVEKLSQVATDIEKSIKKVS